jgi:hypothetical protein
MEAIGREEHGARDKRRAEERGARHKLIPCDEESEA